MIAAPPMPRHQSAQTQPPNNALIASQGVTAPSGENAARIASQGVTAPSGENAARIASQGVTAPSEGSASDELDAARGGSEADDEPAIENGSASDELDAARGGSEADDEPAIGSADEVVAMSRAVAARGEGSASDEPHPTEENRRADEGGHPTWN